MRLKKWQAFRIKWDTKAQNLDIWTYNTWNERSTVEMSVAMTPRRHRWHICCQWKAGVFGRRSPCKLNYLPSRSHFLMNHVWSRLCIGLLLSTLETTIVATALIPISSSLGEYEKSNWIVVSYLLTYTGMSNCIFPNLDPTAEVIDRVFDNFCSR